MKIYSMTATFGKLEHTPLTLEPGLNVIYAPNEWGKSTWCAFIEAMLYGIDTRERNTQNNLAAKERYAPWSGQSMSGRMEICWNGRDITIERSTKGRTPMGEFKAYETKTGLRVPELTATNCGEVLLGVERSVFTRTAFLKLTNLPVDADEALRNRLNALVTTGDESGTVDALAGKLKDLKNKCRFNKTGLLPQTENQRSELQARLVQLQALQAQAERIRQRQAVLEESSKQLENHLTALHYQENIEQAEKLAAAKVARDAAGKRLLEQERNCDRLPDEQQTRTALQELRQLREQLDSLTMESQMLPEAPQTPMFPWPFTGMLPEEMLRHAEKDTQTYRQAQRKAQLSFKTFSPLLGLPVGVLLMLFVLPVVGIAVAAASLVGFGIMMLLRQKAMGIMTATAEKYAPAPVDRWLPNAQKAAEEWQIFEAAAKAYRQKKQTLEGRKQELNAKIQQVTEGCSIAECEDRWRLIEKQREALNIARTEYRQAEELVKAMDSAQAQIQMPDQEDTLTCSEEETRRLLAEIAQETRSLQDSLSKGEGQRETLGSEDALKQQLELLDERIEKLEDMYGALVIAQQTVEEASDALQRRFAPRISRRAQELFGRLTGSRYDRLMMNKDLSLNVGAAGEDTLRSSMWRSDGTVDQLYLALRLAVAEELAPGAPMILDDALVRFDDTRMASALQILKEVAEEKQVILFTCQTREQEILQQ